MGPALFADLHLWDPLQHDGHLDGLAHRSPSVQAYWPQHLSAVHLSRISLLPSRNGQSSDARRMSGGGDAELASRASTKITGNHKLLAEVCSLHQQQAAQEESGLIDHAEGHSMHIAP